MRRNERRNVRHMIPSTFEIAARCLFGNYSEITSSLFSRIMESIYVHPVAICIYPSADKIAEYSESAISARVIFLIFVNGAKGNQKLSKNGRE